MNKRATRLLLQEMSRGTGKYSESAIATVAGFNESQLSGERRFFWPDEDYRNYYVCTKKERTFCIDKAIKVRKTRARIEEEMKEALARAQQEIECMIATPEYIDLLSGYRLAKQAGDLDLEEYLKEHGLHD